MATRKLSPPPAKKPPAATGEVAERQPRRSPKHRAPQQAAGPRPKKPRPKPKQQELPLRDARRRTEAPRPPSRLARMREEGTLTRMFKVGTAVTTLFLLFAGLWFTVRLFSRSRFFYLQGVEVQGNVRLSEDDIERMVRDNVPEGVLRANLPLIRDNLRKHELISEAQVARLLPDRLRVTIKEREPYTLARRADGSVAAVDRNGVLFGDEHLFRGLTVPPLVSGLEEGPSAAEINRQRMLLYQQLLAELDQQTPPLSSRIDEVIFDENGDIRLILAGSGIAVLVGREDFRARLNAALDVLEAVRRRDADALRVLSITDAERLLSGARIVYVNATIPKRVIVGLAE